MRKIKKFSVIWFVIINCMLYSMTTSASNQTFHHQMEITLLPDTSEIRVKDHISVPAQSQDHKIPIKLDFSLHGDLTVTDAQGAQVTLRQSNAASRSRPIPSASG